MSPYVGLIPAFLNAVSRWMFTILVVGAWPAQLRFSYTQRFALALFMFSAALGWINCLAIISANGFGVQLACSLCASILDWLAFVFIFNGVFALERQQLQSLVFSLITSSLWDAQYRIMI